MVLDRKSPEDSITHKVFNKQRMVRWIKHKLNPELERISCQEACIWPLLDKDLHTFLAELLAG